MGSMIFHAAIHPGGRSGWLCVAMDSFCRHAWPVCAMAACLFRIGQKMDDINMSRLALAVKSLISRYRGQHVDADRSSAR